MILSLWGWVWRPKAPACIRIDAAPACALQLASSRSEVSVLTLAGSSLNVQVRCDG